MGVNLSEQAVVVKAGMASVLAKAMLTKEDIRNLLARRFCNDIHKKLSEIPTPSALKDIYKGANRIKEAIEKNERIAIVGDYDVDGVVSSVILAEFF